MDLIPGLGRFPGEGNENRLQYSGLENPMDRGAWRATVQQVAESDMTEATEHACMPVTLILHVHACFVAQLCPTLSMHACIVSL